MKMYDPRGEKYLCCLFDKDLAMRVACAKGRISFVQLLMDNGADVNLKSANGVRD